MAKVMHTRYSKGALKFLRESDIKYSRKELGKEYYAASEIDAAKKKQ